MRFSSEQLTGLGLAGILAIMAIKVVQASFSSPGIKRESPPPAREIRESKDLPPEAPPADDSAIIEPGADVAAELTTITQESEENG